MWLNSMTHMIMLVVPVITGVIVCLRLPGVAVFVCVRMAVQMVVSMPVQMGMSFACMRMCVDVLMRMIVLMRVLMFVGSFHLSVPFSKTSLHQTRSLIVTVLGAFGGRLPITLVPMLEESTLRHLYE